MKLRAFKWEVYTRKNAQNINSNELYVWSHDETGQATLLKIRDYPSTFYIELPDDYTPKQAMLVATFLRLRFSGEIMEVKYEEKEKLYGALVFEKTFPHLLVKVYCEWSIYSITKVLDYPVEVPGIGEIQLTYHETNIPTVLKLQTEKDIDEAGWLEVEDYSEETPEETKTALPEFWAYHSDIKAVVDASYRDIVKPCKILSFDHEVYSERDSQMPNKDNWKDVIFMTGITTKTYREDATIKKYVFMTYKRPDFDSKKSRYLDPPFTKEQVCAHVRPDITIKWFDKERDLIHGIERFICEYDPDVLIGYNILGFDYSYMHARLTRINDQHTQMGRIHGLPPKWRSQEWASGAYGKQEFGWLNMQGRISIDLLPVIKREHKLPTYKLDFVAEKFVGEKKEDVSFKDIFKYYKSDDPELHARIANYCSTDTELPIKLFEKFHIWPSVVVTSCIVNVPINDLYTRGQQIRGYYQIYRLATKKNIVVKYTPKGDDESISTLLNEDGEEDVDDDGDQPSTAAAKKKKEQYSGATVVEPKIGLHEEILSFDFKSLYPSIQRGYNICYTTFVPEGVYVPSHRIHTMEWDDTKDGKHYKFQWIKDRMGIVPQLLKHLVDQRDEARAGIKKTNDESLKVVLDMRQLQLKVSANSLYGMMGVGNGKAYLPLKEGAQCVTFVGRTVIDDTIKRIIEIDVGKIKQQIIEKQTGKMVPYEPLKPDGVTEFPKQKNICVYGDSVTGDTPLLIQRPGGMIETCRIDSLTNNYTIERGKDFGYIDAQVWSENGWTPIQRVIRHYTTKKLYRITTMNGTVDVTEDHSLLDYTGKKVRPTDVDVGTQLLHTNIYKSLHQPDIKLSDKGYKMLEEYKNGILDSNFYNNFGDVIIPAELLKVTDMEDCKKIWYAILIAPIHPKNKEFILGNYIITRRAGLQYGFIDDMLSVKKWPTHKNEIVSISYLGITTDYVYDLTTESHHFHVGPGELVVHNTDSCMIKFGIKEGDPGFEIGDEIARHISSTLPPPMKLESENWFARYLIITKKRYSAIKRAVEDMLKKGLKKGDAMLDMEDQYKKGLADARRDNCLYLRETCTTTLRKIMVLTSIEDIRDYILDRCFALLYQNVSPEELMISTAINQEKYKSESAFQNCLANALRARGFDIRVGDRIEFFFKWVPELPGVKTLKADHTEVMEALRTNRETIHIDYEKYISNQLQKPIDQLTKTCHGVEYIKGLLVVLKIRKKMMEELVGLFASVGKLIFVE